MKPEWRKSSRSQGNGAACVQMRLTGPAGSVEVGDSKLAETPVLTISQSNWSGFLATLTR
ncbi:hypothetical protein Afil01_61680 [Actinorhabdospora filicis]|uniref:DUF397 domain-containing protein n=1 Tax=Actinorhabdospora filicis TaxID=1785913 RepID=A0A9W6SS17_9ACTN|nr:DUF397 domain-containing protein [Actinorhabdospora filicis]GLZ81361.1 hypothetical protein Afil01_61680 [Actinorhabdospora filicis]